MTALVLLPRICWDRKLSLILYRFEWVSDSGLRTLYLVRLVRFDGLFVCNHIVFTRTPIPKKESACRNLPTSTVEMLLLDLRIDGFDLRH